MSVSSSPASPVPRTLKGPSPDSGQGCLQEPRCRGDRGRGRGRLGTGTLPGLGVQRRLGTQGVGALREWGERGGAEPLVKTSHPGEAEQGPRMG